MSFNADSPLVTVVLEEPNHSGYSDKDYIVVHDIECPPGQGWAQSLGGPNYLQNPNEQASVHYIVDATQIVQGLPESLWAWGTGSPGSEHGIHIEQAGYASFTRDQWLGSAAAIGSQYSRPNGTVVTYTAQDATDMGTQLTLYAHLIADIHQRHGWGSPNWMGDAELISATQGNATANHVTMHRQITADVGGTVHSDPGPDYPTDVLILQAQTIYGGGSQNPTPATPAPAPAPTDWLDQLMALDRNSAEYKNLLADIANQVLSTKLNVKWKADDPDYRISVAGLLSGLSLQTKANWQRNSAIQGSVTAIQSSIAAVQATIAGLAKAIQSVGKK